MNKYLTNKIKSKENNRIKQVYNLLKEEDLSVEEIEYIFNDVYDFYIEDINAENKQFNDLDFEIYLEEYINDLLNNTNELEEFLEDPRNSNILTIKISLKNHPKIYRIIEIPTYFRVCDLAYATFASFNAYNGYDYSIIYKNDEFYPGFLYEDEMKIHDVINAEMTILHFINLNVGDKLLLNYNDEIWKFEIEILNIKSNEEKALETMQIIEKKGMDILDGEEELFSYLIKGDYNRLSKACDSEEHFNYLVEYYESKEYEKIDNEDFVKLLEMQAHIYEDIEDEYDIEDDEQIALLEERERREDYINKLPNVVLYNNLKDQYMEVMDVLANYYSNHEDEYREKLSVYFKNRIKHIPTKISLNSIKLEGASLDNIIVSQILPIDKSYESVSELFLNKKYFKGDKLEMLKAMINSEYGLYVVIDSSIDNATIKMKNVITNKEITIIDKNLSFALHHYNIPLYFATRILKTKSINFAISCEILQPSKEIDDYIKKMKKEYPTSIDFFMNMAHFKNNQL